MSERNDAALSVKGNFDEDFVAEAERIGYFNQAIAELPDGREVVLCFCDLSRLAQDLESGHELGRVAVGEPGLVVVEKVTIQNVQRAITDLYQIGYFDRVSTIVRKKVD